MEETVLTTQDNIPRSNALTLICTILYKLTPKKNINTQLMMLKNLIIDAKIKPDETSTKLLELLELNASQNSEHLKSCCAIFHENLFVVENPMLTMNDDIEASVYSRYTIAFNVLLNCLKKYDCPDIAEKDLSRGFYNRIPNVRNGEPRLKSITKQLLEEVVYNNMTLNDFLISLQNNVYGPNCEKPFARYCIAAYYTYLNSYVPL
ncbi:uncharacterized protein LOC126894920 isoform X15 [Daktulosphaira vitifoliae]|uniref:uncharacterized protein LOC126894920 isoform X15 n=1 Tax=Daktulosphaira vitifoliae TaxID=58002 RepID=UPI0021A9D732|nr:uncharacterized protein LOC126894920 isoform X15 [Daktulosphaira vitifoliae]